MDSSEFQEIFLYEMQETTFDMLLLVEEEDVGLVAEVRAPFYYKALSRQINLSRSLNQLPLREYITADSCQVFYYDEYDKLYVFVGIYPFEKDVSLRAEDFQGCLRIKFRPIITYYPQEYAGADYTLLDDDPKVDTKKRVKERTIRQVLLNVSRWREIAESKKCTLQAAAKVIGLPKKTLDDYYAQIKLGETFGFDFQLHQTDGIGILRKFVKEKRDKKKAEPKILEKYLGVKKGEWSDEEE